VKITGAPLLPQLKDPATPGHPAISSRGGATTIRTDTHRLIAHSNGGYFELYDHRNPDAETKNLAKDQPELVAELHATLKKRRSR
jgi:iduronate 2-sulfatase